MIPWEHGKNFNKFPTARGYAATDSEKFQRQYFICPSGHMDNQYTSIIGRHKCSSTITKARVGLTNTETFEQSRDGNAVKWGGKFSETKLCEKNVKGYQTAVALCSQVFIALDKGQQFNAKKC